MPFVCPWCELGQHSRCWVPQCTCSHAEAPWLHPERRAALRAGADPTDGTERAFRAAYLDHRATREAADAHRA